MRGRSLGSKSGGVVAALALGACQSIIGISSYDIDPSLDDAEIGGASLEGGATGSPSTSNGGGLVDAGGGDGGGGQAPRGGTETGGAETGGAPSGGESGCSDPAECDDGIDCTVDTCDAGVCTSTPDTNLCAATSDECVTCQAGIGCVLGDRVVQELLLDPSFDDMTANWVEYSDNFDNNIFVEAGAQSGARIVKLGPAPLNATKQEYADLLQYVTIPDGTIGLTFSGYYKLAPGTKKPAADYVVAGLYEMGGREPFAQFHSWAGDSGAKTAWTAFSYGADRADIQAMWGLEYTFDVVARTWDSVYRLDTLSLQATVCR
jgi:hypothetical protein